MSFKKSEELFFFFLLPSIVLAIGIMFAGCAAPAGNDSLVVPKSGGISINGAGASFPYPLLSKWSSEYYKIKPEVQINYQSIGSGGGIRQITEKTVDFAASDAPLSDSQDANLSGILHIPETIGAVAIVYNLPDAGFELKLTGDVIAGIYLGKIQRWNDPQIASLNPGIKFPDQEILVAHRSDGSGTTFVFSDYLATVSHEWATRVGRGTALNWPLGLGGKGNEGVGGIISQNPYSIGYLELAYARIQKMSVARVKNQAGNFTEPVLESVRAAALQSVQNLPKGNESWSRVSIVNAPGDDSYPISSFTYLLVYRDQKDPVKGKELAGFLLWVIHDGQKYSSDLFYVPLPQEVVRLNEETLRLMNYKGEVFIKR